MTEPHHAPIVDALKRAWAAEAEGRYADAELVIHDLHVKFGSPAVRAVVLALLAGPTPTGGSHA